MGEFVQTLRHTSAFKRQVFFALEDPMRGGKGARAFAAFIFILIIANVVLAFTEMQTDADGKIAAFLTPFDVFSLIFFCIEYLLRIWTADLLHPQASPARARLRYIVSPMGLVDLFAFLPSILPFLFHFDVRIIKSIRLIRLLRMFKITRYMTGFTSIMHVFRTRANQILSAFTVLLLLIMSSAVLMYEAEHAAQPDIFTSVWTSLYWAITTITTTGYGDITPITPLGRCFAFIIMILSIGVVAIPAGILSAGFVEETQKTRDSSLRARNDARLRSDLDLNMPSSDTTEDNSPYQAWSYCPYCGHKRTLTDDPQADHCPYCGAHLR
ncbi:MAG: ion transporter [Eggerthellaceae bacterium]|jgi:voltage-gated potassium channel|nr:ion transporter [Eggerthellaceae bacterium]